MASEPEAAEQVLKAARMRRRERRRRFAEVHAQEVSYLVGQDGGIVVLPQARQLSGSLSGTASGKSGGEDTATPSADKDRQA
ncbi:MAG: hypothetical protein WDM94_09190 [Bauldia sp.]